MKTNPRSRNRPLKTTRAHLTSAPSPRRSRRRRRRLPPGALAVPRRKWLRKRTVKFNWTPENVSATKPAARSIRTYIEQTELREMLVAARLPEGAIAAEYGCGFGRLLPVLQEFSDRVYGYERNIEMALLAAKLLPDAKVFRVENLWQANEPFDFGMTFTVLQHMSDKDAISVINTMKRSVMPTGKILIGEDTDPSYRFQDKDDPTHFTIGRSVAWYREALKPFKLIIVKPRRVEPGYKSRGKPRPIVGHLMLFMEGAKWST